MRMARESWILILICTADLASTIWFVNHMGAAEANPMMKFFLDLGVIPFILAKMAFVAAPLLILEWARRRRPQFVHAMLRVTIVLYLGSYGAVVWRINGGEHPEMTQAEMQSLMEWCAQPATPVETGLQKPRLAKGG